MKAHFSPPSICRLTSVGAALPALRVSNQALAERLAQQGVETSDDWIQARTGIKSRYLAAPEQKTSDLAADACRQALQRAHLDAAQIDLLIVATSTPDMIFPSTACHVQRKIGLERAVAFDVQAVCSGFVYALTVADAMMKVRGYQHALVVGAETFSSILDWQNRGTCVLFGDGAGAVVVSRQTLTEQAASQPPQGIIDCMINADGRYHDILCVPGHVQQGAVQGDPFLRMDGQAVFKFAVNILAECAEKIMARSECTANDIDWCIPHQANQRIMSAIGKKLNLPEAKIISMVHEHANTSAASIPLALAAAVDEGKIRQNDRLLMLGVGGGFTWGGVLATWGNAAN